MRYFTLQIRLILASHSFALTLLKASWRRCDSLMGFVTLKKGLHSAVCEFCLAFVCLNTYPLSSFSSCLSVSFSLCWSDVEVFLPLWQSSPPVSSSSSSSFHLPLAASSRPSLHPSIDPSFVRQSSKDVLFSFNSTSMNQSLVAARDIFSCFTLGALC